MGKPLFKQINVVYLGVSFRVYYDFITNLFKFLFDFPAIGVVLGSLLPSSSLELYGRTMFSVFSVSVDFASDLLVRAVFWQLSLDWEWSNHVHRYSFKWFSNYWHWNQWYFLTLSGLFLTLNTSPTIVCQIFCNTRNV